MRHGPRPTPHDQNPPPIVAPAGAGFFIAEPMPVAHVMRIGIQTARSVIDGSGEVFPTAFCLPVTFPR